MKAEHIEPDAVRACLFLSGAGLLQVLYFEPVTWVWNMISVIYASLSALMIVWLSLNVIKHRRANKISVGDGGNKALVVSMAVQSNAVEYIPITLLLLFALELNNASLFLVHAFGLALLVGRLLHARGLLLADLKVRVLGMQLTLFTILGLATINFLYLPYGKIFNF